MVIYEKLILWRQQNYNVVILFQITISSRCLALTWGLRWAGAGRGGGQAGVVMTWCHVSRVILQHVTRHIAAHHLADTTRGPWTNTDNHIQLTFSLKVIGSEIWRVSEKSINLCLSLVLCFVVCKKVNIKLVQITTIFVFSQSFILLLHLLKGSSNTGQFYYLCYDIVFLRL